MKIIVKTSKATQSIQRASRHEWREALIFTMVQQPSLLDSIHYIAPLGALHPQKSLN